MSSSPIEFLAHIRDETDYIYSSIDGLSRDEFLEDETFKRAFVRSMEIISECAKAVPDEFRRRYPAVEWEALEAITSKLIHGCFGTDYDIVWDFATSKAPELRHEVGRILEVEGKDEM